MSISYRATPTDCDWKQQSCCACGCVFRSVLEPVGKRRRPAPSAEEQEPNRAPTKRQRYRVHNFPCPTCGTYQPDVAACGKLLWHGVLTVLSLVPLALFIGMGSAPSAEGALTTDLSAMLAAAVAGGFALLHLAVALTNPNGNLALNLQLAEKAIAEYRLEMVQPGLSATPPRVPANLTALHCLAMLSLLVAGPAFLAAVYARSSNGWPNNAELRPELVGPGDVVRVEVPARHVQTLGSHWRGEVTARVLNAAELGCVSALKAQSGTHSWSESLRAKKDGVEGQIYPFAFLTLPDDPTLGGKSLRVRVHLLLTYPVRISDKTSGSEKTTVSRDFAIQLTSVEDRQTYWLAWRIGAGTGFFCCIGGGLTLICLAFRLSRRALPSTMVLRHP